MNLTVLIPTFNERENVRLIVKRIQSILSPRKCSYEILFVDDSKDDTPLMLARLSHQYPNVRYRHRTKETGLASAVVEGFRFAKGDNIIVMDADLQHPPELIPVILDSLEHADVVIPSRFITGGSDGGLNLFRKFVSWSARVIGQLSISKLRRISDCTGGYFGITRSVINGVTLDPVGWKILIEVLAKGNYRTVHEIPYGFDERENGQSKMCLREQWNYLKHIARLVQNSQEDRRFYCFCLVGTLGLLVNMLSLFTFISIVHLGEVVSSVSASSIAMIHNFIWNDRRTWKGHQRQSLWQRLLQFIQFTLVSTVGITVSAFCVKLFVWFGWNVYGGQLLGITVATWWNYAANNRWTWGRDIKETRKTQPDLIVVKAQKKIT